MGDLAQQNLTDLNLLPCGCLIVAQDNRIVFANQYFAEKLGFKVHALVGQRTDFLFSKATQLFCESYVFPTVLSEGQCCEVQVSLLNSEGASVPKVASVRQLPNGKFAWIFIEAEQRNRLFEELESARQALQEQREQLEFLARTDPLTGLANRRELERSARLAILGGRRSGAPVSGLILDVDHFKTLNDAYGHEEGDKALSALAKVLKSACRESDIVARLGGDEFACILTDTNLNSAKSLGDRIRKEVEKIESTTGAFTVSIGIAELEKDVEMGLHELLRQADSALYAAKRAGRNSTKSALAHQPETKLG